VVVREREDNEKGKRRKRRKRGKEEKRKGGKEERRKGEKEKNTKEHGARICTRCRLRQQRTFDGQRKCVHHNHSVTDDLALQETHDLQGLARAGVHDLGVCELPFAFGFDNTAFKETGMVHAPF
jgi:hypothetical protein